MEVNAHNMPAGTASPLHSSAVTSPEKHYVKAAVYIRLQWEQGRSDYDLTYAPFKVTRPSLPKATMGSNDGAYKTHSTDTHSQSTPGKENLHQIPYSCISICWCTTWHREAHAHSFLPAMRAIIAEGPSPKTIWLGSTNKCLSTIWDTLCYQQKKIWKVLFK